MNIYKIGSISLVLLLLIGCAKDDEITADLHWDGPNQDAPDLVAGVHEAAVKFPTTLTSNFIGRTIESIEYFIQDVPTSAEMIIYGTGFATTPGNILYQKDIINEIRANSWNTHVVTTPIALEAQDLWVSIRITHNDLFGSVGCDQGPAAIHGDWLFSVSDGEWKTLRDRTNNVTNINWNIRVFLEE